MFQPTHVGGDTLSYVAASVAGGQSLRQDERRSEREVSNIKWLTNLIAFTEGLTHLASLAIFYFMKEDMHLEPYQVSLAYFLPAFPFIIKPVLAIIADSLPIFGEHRRPYIVIPSLFQALGYYILTTSISRTPWGLVGTLTMISFSTSMCSASAEALMVEISNETEDSLDTAARTNIADYLSAKAAGSTIVAYFSGSLLELYSKKTIFVTTAVFPIIVALLGCRFRESKYTSLTRAIPWQEKVSKVFEIIRKPFLFYPLIFVFLYGAGPDYDDAFFFYLVDVKKMGPRFMGALKVSYGVAAFIGARVYTQYLYNISLKKLLLGTVVIGFPFYVLPIVLVKGWNTVIGISDELFLIGGGFMSEAIVEVQLLPLCIIVTKVCPRSLEATFMSVVVSVKALGTCLSKLDSSLMIHSFGVTKSNFSNLVLLISVCGWISLLPTFIYPVLLDEDAVNENIRKVRVANIEGSYKDDKISLSMEELEEDKLIKDDKMIKDE